MIDFPKVILDRWKGRILRRYDGGGLVGPRERAGKDPSYPPVFQPAGEYVRLPDSYSIEGHIQAALEPLFAVPVRFPMPNQVNASHTLAPGGLLNSKRNAGDHQNHLIRNFCDFLVQSP